MGRCAAHFVPAPNTISLIAAGFLTVRAMISRLYFKEGCIFLSHGLQKKPPIKKEVPDLATRLSYKQTSMAGGAMGRSIPAPVIWFVIGANRIIRTNP